MAFDRSTHFGWRGVIAALVAAAVAHGSPVIDDAALEKSFIDGLDKPGIGGIDGPSAARALAGAEGKSTEINPAEAEPALDYKAVCRSVVVIGSIGHCKDCHNWHMDSVSTGWVLDPRGRIVTNYHVLEDIEAGELGVMTFDGNVFAVREILAADRAGDAVILSVDTRGTALSALPLADSVKTGEPVRVVGHPDGRFYSLTEGIVSRVFTQAADEDGKARRTWITITADYGSGSSGAPVVNGAGEVVGMVSSTAALLADTEADKEPKAEDVQMVFRDCVSVDTMRRLVAD